MEELLPKKEQKVMECLYRFGHCPVGKLAKETTINRTTLYPILQKLMQKGLVSDFTQEGVTIYEPVEPELFKDWLKKKKEEITMQSSRLEDWLGQVSSAKPTPSLASKIKYFEGFEGVKAMYADTWRNNQNKIIYAITDVKAAVGTMGKFFYEKYMPNRMAHKVKVRDIMTENKEGRHEVKVTSRYLREAKLAKDLFKDLGVEINMYDNKMAIAAFDTEKPCGIIIENAKIASAMKNIFEYLWKSI